MKNIIAAVSALLICASSMLANPVIIAELAKIESSNTAKDNQIAELSSKLAEAQKKIDSLTESPDFDQAVKVKFNSIVAETKTKLQTITDEVIAKLKKGETK